jgi:LysR family transcriptional regulator, regulator of abg operon
VKINSIRDFLAVAEHGSLRSAARHLGLAQPAMTRSIQELERELGATLFERRAKGVQLTTMGDVLLRRARSVRSELARAKEEIDQLKGAVHGHIRMCLSGVAHMALLADSLPAFRQRFPAVKLEVVDAVLPRVQLELIGGTMDLYIGPVPEKPTSELAVEKLFDNKRVVLGRRGHPLAGARSLREIADAEWITMSGVHHPEDELTLIFREQGLPEPRSVIQGHSALTFFFVVAHTDLLAMLPVQWAQTPLFRGFLQTIDVVDPLAAAPICLVHRAGLPLTPAAQYFCDMVRRAALHVQPLAR